MVQVLTDLNLVIKKAYISSDGGWFMDGMLVLQQQFDIANHDLGQLGQGKGGAFYSSFPYVYHVNLTQFWYSVQCD